MARPAGRTMLQLTCANCGRSFLRRKGQEKPVSFCTRRCYWISAYRSGVVAGQNSDRNPGAKQTRPCANCGVDVTRYVSTGQREFFCSVACRWENRKKPHARQRTSQGYILVYVGRDYPNAIGSGHILEHRKVMQEHLGRPLWPDENVHHLNGVRDDNRLENLELWSRSQPSGQRVEDKLRWAKWFITRYE